MPSKFLDAPDGFKILKVTEPDYVTYKFILDRQYMYRVSPEDLALSESWMEKEIVAAGLYELVKDLKQRIANYEKETN